MVKTGPGVKLGLMALLLAAVVLCSSCGVEATDKTDDSTLLSLLKGVPADVAQGENFVYFIDFSAMEEDYGMTRPTKAAASADLSGASEGVKAWVAMVGHSSWSQMMDWRSSVVNGQETVGFTTLQVDQVLQFGQGPSTGLVLTGSFDAKTVAAAYQAALGLQPEVTEGYSIWRAQDGVNGSQIDLSNRLPENPFGGEWGRRQPMSISDSEVMSSADLQVVLGHLAAVDGEVPTLREVAGYADAVNAVGQDATVLQAAILGANATQAVSVESEEVVRELYDDKTLEGLLDGFAELPAYELLILADTATDTEQVARLGLVFGDIQAAEGAASILVDRLEHWPSSEGRSYAEILTMSKETSPRYYIYETSGRVVLVIEFATPKAATGAELAATLDDSGFQRRPLAPGVLYGRLLNLFMQHETGWLTTATKSQFEQVVAGD